MGGCTGHAGAGGSGGLSPSIVELFGKILVISGLALAAIGALLWGGCGRGWLGRLPGDIQSERGSFGLYFPIVTCILISVILTVVVNFFRR